MRKTGRKMGRQEDGVEDRRKKTVTKMGRQEEVDRKREGKMGGGRQEEEGEEGMRRQEDRLEDRRWLKTGRGRG